MSYDIKGFYICGSTGEGLVLPKKTRMELLEVVLDEIGGKLPVIDHIGAIDLATGLELARHAEKAGAAAVSSIPPIYFNYSDDDVFNYYKAISEASSLPLIMYGVVSASTKLSLELVKRVMTLPTSAGIKWTYPDYFTLGRIKDIDGGNINVINGPDEMLVCGLAMGADAGIGTTYNMMPGLFVKLYDSFRAGDTVTARNIQHAINKVIALLVKYNVLPATKSLLNYMGFDVGSCVYPLGKLTGEREAEFISEVTKIIDFKRQEIL